jgi:hypothetical protein
MSDGKRKQGPGGNGPASKKSKVSTKLEPLYTRKFSIGLMRSFIASLIDLG